MIFLSGDDGNAYWYMHNQENLVTGGHVSAGQQIATLGDTGNAAGHPAPALRVPPGRRRSRSTRTRSSPHSASDPRRCTR